MKRKIKIIAVTAYIPLIAAFLMQGCTPEPKSTEELWEGSGHADATAEAFRHWDEEDPAEISTSCAKCHTTTGFMDFIADGTVDAAVPVGEVINCEACHSDQEAGTLRNISSVTFPSELTISGLDDEAICMTCHQGSQSKYQVDNAIAELGLEDDDTVSTDLRFKNIHYYAAAATMFGTTVKGGYEYESKRYDARLVHVGQYDTCTECHDPHTLNIKVAECAECHTSVATEDDLHDIRFYGSVRDYDGDGNTNEGIGDEIAGLQAALYSSMQAYAGEIAGSPIAYDSHRYPYFFVDANGNGSVDAGEGSGYAAWTGRLLKGAYNYQFSLKDPGAFAHGGKYIIELLYDSIEDLNTKIAHPADMSGMNRTDEGHFDGSAEAFRHWDEEDPAEVSTSCSKCHSAFGLAAYVAFGETSLQPLANGLACATCHFSVITYTRMNVDTVPFPSGLTADLEDDSNLCMSCHQGRESKTSVDAAEPAADGTYGFKNIHYFPVGSIFFGTDVQGGYEYDGRTYNGKMVFPAPHAGKYDTCVQCHMGSTSGGGNHDVTDLAGCADCHGDVHTMRLHSTEDYDGDGDTSEALMNEIDGLTEKLYAELMAYGHAQGNPIVYDANTYPYFFKDTDSDGVADADEANYGNKYAFDTVSLKAAFNYQASIKEPYAFIHNALYMAQLLVDSIESLGGDVSAYTWR